MTKTIKEKGDIDICHDLTYKQRIYRKWLLGKFKEAIQYKQQNPTRNIKVDFNRMNRALRVRGKLLTNLDMSISELLEAHDDGIEFHHKMGNIGLGITLTSLTTTIISFLNLSDLNSKYRGH